LKVHVLDYVNSRVDQQSSVHREIPDGRARRPLLVGARVSAGCDDASFSQPLGSRDGYPGHSASAAEISRGTAPQPCPPGADQDHVAGPDDDPVLLRRGLQVGRADAVARREVVATVQFRHVEQHPSGKQWRDSLGAVLGEAPATLSL
jgi:hypothetical protein